MYREFYIIQEGFCEAISVLTNRDKKTLRPTEYFGVMEMLLGKPSMQDIRSVTHLKLIRISHVNLQKVFSSDRENYEHLSSKFSNQLPLISVKQFFISLLFFRSPDPGCEKFTVDPKIKLQ